MTANGKRPRVGLDVDGVLADLLTPMLEILSSMRDERMTIAMMSGHDLDGLIPLDDRGRPRAAEFWGRVGKRGCRNLAVYPGAVEGVRRLREVADVYVVTSHLRSGERWVHERDAWLREHFDIPHAKVVHTAAKYTFLGAMLVDDKPGNIEAWAAEHPTGVPVLWAQPYNEHTAEIDGAVRTDSWVRVAELVRELGR